LSIRGALLLIALLAGPVQAQDVPFDPARIEACLANSDVAALCVGAEAAACMQKAGAGSTGLCLGTENAFWLARIDALAARLGAGSGLRAERAARRGTPSPTVAQLAEAFAAYRQVACDLRVAAWEGMMTGPEEIDCELRINAAHALYLTALLAP